MKILEKSWRVVRINGVDVRLHISMLLFIPFMMYLFEPGNQSEWLVAGMQMGGLLVSILLHELGHAFMSQRLGVKARQIVIWPLGGFTELERGLEKPLDRLLLAAAGPLVNLVLALLLAVLYWLSLAWPEIFWNSVGFFWSELLFEVLFYLCILNVILVVLNLLPVYLLDGGTIFRSIMEMFFTRKTTDALSMLVGIPFLLGLVVLGIVTRDVILLMVCVLLALGVATLNPRSQRWLNLGLTFLLRRGSYYQMTGDLDQAVSEFTRELQKNPRAIAQLIGRAMVYIALEENALALADVLAVLEIEPQHLLALELRGELHQINKENELALEFYERVKQIKPDVAYAYIDCGGVYLNLKQYERALLELNRGIALQPQVALYLLVRSLAHYRLGDLQAAHRDQDEAVRLSSQQGLVMPDYNLEIYEGELDWAMDFYERVLQKNAGEWRAHLGWADAQAANGRYAEAMAGYDKAAQLAPREALVFLRRGKAYRALGQAQAAEEDFRAALQLAQKSQERRQAEKLLKQMSG